MKKHDKKQKDSRKPKKRKITPAPRPAKFPDTSKDKAGSKDAALYEPPGDPTGQNY